MGAECHNKYAARNQTVDWNAMACTFVCVWVVLLCVWFFFFRYFCVCSKWFSYPIPINPNTLIRGSTHTNTMSDISCVCVFFTCVPRGVSLFVLKVG